VNDGHVSFRVAPLAVLVTAAAAALLFGPAWSARMAVFPWLVALFVVGLPHGAADLAVSRRLCGWPITLRLFAAYAALMAAVLSALVIAPQPTVTVFAALSIWHFGLSHAQGQSPAVPAGWRWQTLAAMARGASVLGVPLAAWPAETSAVIGRLLSLIGKAGPVEPPAFASEAIRVAGLCLTITGMLSLASEAVLTRHAPGCLRRSADTLLDLLIIGSLGVSADPLLSIGLYFLCWHAWREMRPLTTLLAQPAGSDHSTTDMATLVRNVVAVHVAALPLLIPTWAALGAAWWLRSPSHSLGDLAVLSLAVYLVVTPAHEALHDVLRAGCPPRSRRTQSSPCRHPFQPCAVHSASS